VDHRIHPLARCLAAAEVRDLKGADLVSARTLHLLGMVHAQPKMAAATHLLAEGGADATGCARH
jgi:hypothetical protein